MSRIRLTRAEKQTLEDNASHLSSIRDEIYEAQGEINRKINTEMDEMGITGDLRDDCFQEAWLAQLQGKSIREAVERFVRAEKEYKKKFSR